MVNWKRIELIAGPDAEDHIKRHGVSISDVFNVDLFPKDQDRWRNKIYYIGKYVKHSNNEKIH